jgi:hypothetical protein
VAVAMPDTPAFAGNAKATAAFLAIAMHDAQFFDRCISATPLDSV